MLLEGRRSEGEEKALCSEGAGELAAVFGFDSSGMRGIGLEDWPGPDLRNECEATRQS